MNKYAFYSLPVLGGLAVMAWVTLGADEQPTTDEQPVASSQLLADPRPSAAPRTSTRLSERASVAAPRSARADSPTPTPSSAASAAVDTQAARMSPLRAPVIEAIRAAGMKGEEKRKAMLDAIRKSGESDEPWTAEAEDAFETWTDAMPKELRGAVTVAEPRCYAAGCVADVTFDSQDAYRTAAKAFRTIAEPRSGHGGRVQTPSEAQGKRVVASWIMLRPQDI